jgi:Ribonuclease HI
MGVGGAGWVVRRWLRRPDHEPADGADGTLEAVRAFDGPLLIVSDSTYVVHCFRDGWWEKWLRKGWVSSKREPVANREIWEPLIEAVRSRGNVDFRWVKGHSGDRWNDEADRLAVDACSRQVEISG